MRSHQLDTVHTFRRQQNDQIVLLVRHRRSIDLLNVPVSGFVGVRSSRRVLQTVHLAPPGIPVSLVLRAPNNLILTARRVTHTLVHRRTGIAIFVPRCTVDKNAVLTVTTSRVIVSRGTILKPISPRLNGITTTDVLGILRTGPVRGVSSRALIATSITHGTVGRMRQFIQTLLRSDVPQRGISPTGVSGVVSHLAAKRIARSCPVAMRRTARVNLPVAKKLPDRVCTLVSLCPRPVVNHPAIRCVPVPCRAHPTLPADRS